MDFCVCKREVFFHGGTCTRSITIIGLSAQEVLLMIFALVFSSLWYNTDNAVIYALHISEVFYVPQKH